MYWLIAKQTIAAALILVNLILLVSAIVAFKRKSILSASYLAWLRVSPLVALLLVLFGLFFFGRGAQVHFMHVIYGVLVSGGAISQFQLSRKTATGQTYRNRPLVHAFLALFVMLLTARSWMSG